jgi:hypothetical protein
LLTIESVLVVAAGGMILPLVRQRAVTPAKVPFRRDRHPFGCKRGNYYSGDHYNDQEKPRPVSQATRFKSCLDRAMSRIQDMQTKINAINRNVSRLLGRIF